jgi:RimJ/RimL family protein N-acetyltransferase
MPKKSQLRSHPGRPSIATSRKSLRKSTLEDAQEKRLKLELLDPHRKRDLAWLHRFIHLYHSSPKWVLPTLEELQQSHRRFYRAIALAPLDHRGETIGITSFEIKTKYLVETQKTIVAPEFRGQGWGPYISHEIERIIRKQGYLKIRSTIYAENTAMISIKLAQGYTIEGYHPDHDGPGLHEYSLGKILK